MKWSPDGFGSLDPDWAQGLCQGEPWGSSLVWGLPLYKLPRQPEPRTWASKGRLSRSSRLIRTYCSAPENTNPAGIYSAAPHWATAVPWLFFQTCSKGPIKLTPVSLHVLLFLLMGFPGFPISVQPLTTLLGSHTLVQTSLFWFPVMAPIPWVRCPQCDTRYPIFHISHFLDITKHFQEPALQQQHLECLDWAGQRNWTHQRHLRHSW